MKLLDITTEVTESSLLHPLTGLPLRPLGVTKSGRVIWPILGGADSDDDDDPDDLDDDSSDDDSDDDDSDDKSKGKAKTKEGDETPEQRRIKVLAEQRERARKQRDAARKERQDLQERLEKLEQKDKPELDKVTKERDDFKAAAEKADGQLREQAVALAFFNISEFDWKDSGAALELAKSKLKDVDVEDGVADADAVHEVVKELAESKTWLLKDPKEKGKDEPKDDEDSKGNPKNDSGSGGTGSRSKKKQSSDQKLRAKYPALRR